MVSTSGPELTKERQRAKQLLAQQEILFPKLFNSLKSSLRPLVDFQSKVDDSEVDTDEEPFLPK